MPLTDKQKQLIKHIDRRVNKIISRGGSNVKILTSLADIMNDLKTIIDDDDKDELEKYYQKYDGFYRFMKILEGLAVGIADGSISVP